MSTDIIKILMKNFNFCKTNVSRKFRFGGILNINEPDLFSGYASILFKIWIRTKCPDPHPSFSEYRSDQKTRILTYHFQIRIRQKDPDPHPSLSKHESGSATLFWRRRVLRTAQLSINQSILSKHLISPNTWQI